MEKKGGTKIRKDSIDEIAASHTRRKKDGSPTQQKNKVACYYDVQQQKQKFPLSLTHLVLFFYMALLVEDRTVTDASRMQKNMAERENRVFTGRMSTGANKWQRQYKNRKL